MDPRINEKAGEPSSERESNALVSEWDEVDNVFENVTLEEVMSSTLSPYGSLLNIQSHSRKGCSVTLESYTLGWEVKCLGFWY